MATPEQPTSTGAEAPVVVVEKVFSHGHRHVLSFFTRHGMGSDPSLSTLQMQETIEAALVPNSPAAPAPPPPPPLKSGWAKVLKADSKGAAVPSKPVASSASPKKETVAKVTPTATHDAAGAEVATAGSASTSVPAISAVAESSAPAETPEHQTPQVVSEKPTTASAPDAPASHQLLDSPGDTLDGLVSSSASSLQMR